MSLMAAIRLVSHCWISNCTADRNLATVQRTQAQIDLTTRLQNQCFVPRDVSRFLNPSHRLTPTPLLLQECSSQHSIFYKDIGADSALGFIRQCCQTPRIPQTYPSSSPPLGSGDPPLYLGNWESYHRSADVVKKMGTKFLKKSRIFFDIFLLKKGYHNS